MADSGANDVLRRFTRETEWVAAGLLGAVFFVALAFAALVPERYPKTVDPPKEASQAKPGISLNADAATPVKIVDLNAKRTTSEVNSGEPPHVAQTITKNSSNANLAGMAAGAASTPPPDVVLSPEVNRDMTGANGSEWSPRYRQDPARVARARIPHERHRSSGWLRDVDVKMRLIALWHQSLLRSEKARGWAVFSNLNSRKKAACTAGRDP
jgi:hypothetical protein